MSVQILQGDVRTMLATLEPESIQCVVTSPPYFQLRDYGVAGQIGLEATPAEFIATLVGVFEEVRRVLRPDGVCFVNLGDSYAGSGKGPTGANGIGDQEQRQGFRTGNPSRYKDGRAPSNRDGLGSVAGIKPKSLLLIPQRFAIAMQDAGWYVRSQIAWCKTSAMPESVKDRPTSAWEPIWMFTKQARYFWDQEAVRQPHITPLDKTRTNPRHDELRLAEGRDRGRVNDDPIDSHPAGANLRNYWLLGPEPFKGVEIPGSEMVALGLADYVGPDGKARKVSPDCPSHGLPIGLRTSQTAGYGERLAGQTLRSPDTANHPDLAPSCAAVSTLPDSLASESSSALSQTQHDTRESRPSDAEPQQAEPRNHPRNGHTSRTPADKAGGPQPDCSPTATTHSTSSHRTGRAPVTSPSGTPSAGTPSHTGDTSTLLGLFDSSGSIPESSNGVGSAPNGGGSDLAVQTAPNIVGRREKCSCQIITLDHYAAFPSEIPRRCILAASRPGDTVLDPFLGSGTTALVADQLGRNAIGCELNPKYAEMARRRISNDAPMFADVSVAS